VQWGVFNAVFERKEYAEPYMMEEAARAMFAADPALAAEFDAFATSQPAPTTAQKLDWIYQHHSSWDERVNLLPVFRVQDPEDVRPAKAPGASSCRGRR
jgi:hypothetical protein